MWVFTETGFVSAVRHREHDDILIVRSRDRDSIDAVALRTGTEVVAGAGSDYPYRVFVERAKFAEWVAEQVSNLKYTNYKNHMHDLRDDVFCRALSTVWFAMTDIEDYDFASGTRV